jgi:hypothetical protein
MMDAAAATQHFKFRVFGNFRHLDPRQAVGCMEVSVGKQSLLKGPLDCVTRACDLHGQGRRLRYLHRRSPFWEGYDS